MDVAPASVRVACSGYPYIGALACVSSCSICRTLTLTVLPSTYYIHALLNLTRRPVYEIRIQNKDQIQPGCVVRNDRLRPGSVRARSGTRATGRAGGR